MSQYLQKARFLFAPVVLIGACVVFGYAFLTWLCFQVAGLPRPSTEVLGMWVPMLMPWLPLLIWVRPRTKTLATLKNGNEPGSIYLFVAGIFIAVVTFQVYDYSIRFTGKKIQIATPAAVHSHSDTDYFEIQHHFTNKSRAGGYGDAHISGKHGNNLNFDIYIASPLLTSNASDLPSNVWLGFVGHRTISSRTEQSEQEIAYRQIYQDTVDRFNKKEFGNATYFERYQPGKLLDGFVNAIKTVQKTPSHELVVLRPVFEPFENRLDGGLMWAGIIAVAGSLICLLMLNLVQFDTERLRAYQQQAPANAIHFFSKTFSAIFDRTAIASKILALILGLGFLFTLSHGGGVIFNKGSLLIELGANYGPMTLAGEWWRTLTANGLHGGLMHLAMNVTGLLLIGFTLEPLIGGWRFLVAFVVTGVVASASSIWWNPEVLSVGASGAVYGLFGVLFALLTPNWLPAPVRKSLFSMFGVYAAIGLVLGLSGLMGNVDNAAHVGGAISGYLLGWIMYPTVKRNWGDV